MNIQEYKEYAISRNPKLEQEFNKKDWAFELAKLIIDARILTGITQEILAELLGKQQSSVARAESGKITPSIPYLDKVARVLGGELEIRIKGLEYSSTQNLIMDHKKSMIPTVSVSFFPKSSESNEVNRINELTVVSNY